MKTPTTAEPANRDVSKIVTDRIIAQLKKEFVAWRVPWHSSGIPQNLMTKRPYRGINVILLASLGYARNFFVTFDQLKEIGGRLRQDEKPHLVVSWKWPDPDMKATKEGSLNGREVNGDGGPTLRYYKVYNVSQCENIAEDLIPEIRVHPEPMRVCEEIIKAMPQAPKVQHRDKSPYYNPLHDFVNMPKKDSFDSAEHYYSSFFHQLVHSTGHHSRLNRSMLIQMAEFGADRCSNEELIAEIGTCLLESTCGFNDKSFNPDAAYFEGLIKKLERNKEIIVYASSLAQKAVDFILKVKPELREETATQENTVEVNEDAENEIKDDLPF